jgi:hypothetical protein
VFATGFLDGVPASRGCSAKGKFWSISRVRDLTDWVDWCSDIGKAVKDPGITTDGVFKSAMRPRQISERPQVPPVAIHWPESLLTQIEDRIEINFGDKPVAFAECDIELLDHEPTGPLRFTVRSDTHIAEFEIVFAEGGASYPQRSGPKTTVKVSGKMKSLSESFGEDSPQIDFGDGSLLIYSHLYALPEGVVVEPYSADHPSQSNLPEAQCTSHTSRLGRGSSLGIGRSRACPFSVVAKASEFIKCSLESEICFLFPEGRP